MSRLFPIGMTAFIIASLAIFFFGDSGLTAFTSRARYERSLAANVEDLKQRNGELQARLRLLKTDRETIVIMARGIGMYEQQDTVVKLVGRSPRPPLYAMGDLLRTRKVDSTRNAAFKETTLFVTFIFLLLALAGARVVRGRARTNRPSVNGIRSSLLTQKIRPSGSARGAGRR